MKYNKIKIYIFLEIFVFRQNIKNLEYRINYRRARVFRFKKDKKVRIFLLTGIVFFLLSLSLSKGTPSKDKDTWEISSKEKQKVTSI